jgi:xylulose-5-phosphate/fructose-6-phosphate phosphoketolase
LNDEIIEGSFHAHQVPLPAAATDDQQLDLLNKWLSSYRPHELFNKDGTPTDITMSILPSQADKRMGQRVETYCGYQPQKVRDWKLFGKERGTEVSCMLAIGDMLDKILTDNPTSVRVFSPDELESNKLSVVFKHTNRNFQWDPATHDKGGRVIEILSEHTCQGLLQGTSSITALIQDTH